MSTKSVDEARALFKQEAFDEELQGRGRHLTAIFECASGSCRQNICGRLDFWLFRDVTFHNYRLSAAQSALWGRHLLLSAPDFCDCPFSTYPTEKGLEDRQRVGLGRTF